MEIMKQLLEKEANARTPNSKPLGFLAAAHSRKGEGTWK